jgi:hypothetical protein
VSKAPNLIDLNALADEIAKHAVLVPCGGLASIYNQLGHGRLTGAGKPGHGTDRITFAEQVKDMDASFTVEFVHGPTIWPPVLLVKQFRTG